MTKSAAIVGTVNAVLAGLLAFGVDLSEAQTVAIVGIVNAILVLVAVIKDPKIPFGNVSISRSEPTLPLQYPAEFQKWLLEQVAFEVPSLTAQVPPASDLKRPQPGKTLAEKNAERGRL